MMEVFISFGDEEIPIRVKNPPIEKQEKEKMDQADIIKEENKEDWMISKLAVENNIRRLYDSYGSMDIWGESEYYRVKYAQEALTYLAQALSIDLNKTDEERD